MVSVFRHKAALRGSRLAQLERARERTRQRVSCGLHGQYGLAVRLQVSALSGRLDYSILLLK